MRKPIIVLLGAALILVVAATAALGSSPRNFTAPLSGAEEVPRADTRARGVAIFQLSADGSELSYRLIASNIDNVLMAHIHCCAGSGTNAGIAVWLVPDGPPPPTEPIFPGRQTGTLVTGTITEADLVGPLAGMTLADLVDRIESGLTYVNVHTTAFPGGEIRGQLP